MPIVSPAPKSVLPDGLLVSVVIPVRNEAQNIVLLLQDLARQTLSFDSFEVLVVDDESEDGTADLVRGFDAPYKLSLIPTNVSLQNVSPKKKAILTALEKTNAPLIVCTDGDCRVQADWLQLFASYQHRTGAQWISGGVAFVGKQGNFWEKWQAVEFCSLVGSGAVTLHKGFATMANGANLAYTKNAFEKVGGFEGNTHLASGDDEFLLHKIAKVFPDKVLFLKNIKHTVFTLPQGSFKNFYAQRKRWGSKWTYYKNNGIKALAMAIFFANLSFLWLGLLFMMGGVSFPVFVLLALCKLLPEYMLLWSFGRYFLPASYFAPAVLACFLPVVQLTYPLYVVFFGVISLGGKQYEWKGRKLQ